MLSADEIQALEERPVPGFPGYTVTPLGQVFSVTSNWRGYGKRTLTPHPNSHGYPRVKLRDPEGKHRTVLVHTTVANTFLSPRPEGSEVRHLDGDKNNNAVSNLAWGTAAENAADRDRHGTTARGNRNGARKHPAQLAHGERASNAKLKEADVVAIRAAVDAGEPQRDVATRYGVSESTVSCIILGKTWRGVAKPRGRIAKLESSLLAAAKDAERLRTELAGTADGRDCWEADSRNARRALTEIVAAIDDGRADDAKRIAFEAMRYDASHDLAGVP
jgi:hypothetical protein